MDAEIETKKIMKKAISYYSSLNNKKSTQTQIKIFCDEDLNPKYGVLHDFKVDEYEDVSLGDLILAGKRFDAIGRNIIYPNFINPVVKNLIKRLGKEYNRSTNGISLMVASKDDNCDELVFMVLLDDKPFKRVNFEDILN